MQDSAGQVIGLRVKDKQTGKHSDVYAKVVLNATGPFADGLRKISNPKNAPCLKASSGSHVTLPGFYGSGITGMIIPKTKVRGVLLRAQVTSSDFMNCDGSVSQLLFDWGGADGD